MAGMERLTAQAIVVGAGPSGLMAAIALAEGGIETALIGKPAPADHRTTALMSGSVTALETLGVWSLCREAAAPLASLRIADDTARLLRAPEARFDAEEIGLPAFAYNIENRHLVAAMETRTRALPALRRIEDNVTAVEAAPAAAVTLQGGGRFSADLIVGADGAKSLCRIAAGIETTGWRYPQHALTFNVRHTHPHHNISTEFHTEDGPFTLVPLPGLRSSIVCVVDPAEAERLRALDDAALEREIETRSHSILGKISLEPGRGFFPLAAEAARTFAAQRIALVGEAAHRLPPIGAQGLNLGLRDAATIAELVIEASATGHDIASPGLLSRYDVQRRADVTARTMAVDLLNRSLLSDFLPVQGARGLGIYLMNRIGGLRRAVMKEGVAPAVSAPRLMRGEALR